MLWMYMDSTQFVCWICLKLVSGGIPALQQHQINCMKEMDKKKIDPVKVIPKHYNREEVQIILKQINHYIHKFTGPGKNYPAGKIITCLRSHQHLRSYDLTPQHSYDYEIQLPQQIQSQNNNDNDDDDPTKDLTDELNKLDDDHVNDNDEQINDINPHDTRTTQLNYYIVYNICIYCV